MHNDSQNKISLAHTHTPSKASLVTDQKKGLLANLSSQKQTKVSKQTDKQTEANVRKQNLQNEHTNSASPRHPFSLGRDLIFFALVQNFRGL